MVNRFTINVQILRPDFRPSAEIGNDQTASQAEIIML
jgi:hypothetical protein